MELLVGESIEIAGTRVTVTGVSFREQGEGARTACVSFDVQAAEQQADTEQEAPKLSKRRR